MLHVGSYSNNRSRSDRAEPRLRANGHISGGSLRAGRELAAKLNEQRPFRCQAFWRQGCGIGTPFTTKLVSGRARNADHGRAVDDITYPARLTLVHHYRCGRVRWIERWSVDQIPSCDLCQNAGRPEPLFLARCGCRLRCADLLRNVVQWPPVSSSPRPMLRL
jgi:hypothetical protein